MRVADVFTLTAELAQRCDCRTGLDIGCGERSPLSPLRPRLYAVGVEVNEPSLCAAAKILDRVYKFDILKDDFSRFEDRFDIVCLIGVIEHLPKRVGWELLDRCEALTQKLIVVETPNGFQPQGPEYGNENQRHLSGWFPHDFEGLGYTVWGTSGLKALVGYAAGPKYPYTQHVNQWLARLLNIRRNSRLAYNLFAWKDVRGVPARLGPPTLNGPVLHHSAPTIPTVRER